MNINGIELADKGTLYPVDEITARRIDLANHINKTGYKNILVSILEAIIDYNSKWVTDQEKNFRIFYYLRTINSILTPNYERLSPDKSAIIVSVDGEALKRNVMLEIIEMECIEGIGSDLFDLEGFTTAINHNLDIGDLIKRNSNKIREMYKEWCSNTNLKDETYVKIFNDHMKEINSMTSYNNAKFFKEKRDYINHFLDFLDNRIGNGLDSADGSVAVEDLIKIRDHFNIR